MRHGDDQRTQNSTQAMDRIPNLSSRINSAKSIGWLPKMNMHSITSRNLDAAMEDGASCAVDILTALLSTIDIQISNPHTYYIQRLHDPPHGTERVWGIASITFSDDSKIELESSRIKQLQIGIALREKWRGGGSTRRLAIQKGMWHDRYNAEATSWNHCAAIRRNDYRCVVDSNRLLWSYLFLEYLRSFFQSQLPCPSTSKLVPKIHAQQSQVWPTTSLWDLLSVLQ